MISTLFFNHQFKHDLDWKEHKLRIGAVQPANKDQLSRSLKDLSRETIRNRFLGSKKEFSSLELEYLTNFDGWNHYAIGIEERENPNRGVAIARLVRSGTQPEEAEIAITIIDEYQNQGLGSVLMKLIALAAIERKIERLSFTFLPQNEGIIRLIHKIGKVQTGSMEMDCMQLFVDTKDINVDQIKKRLEPHLPWIGTFGS